MMKKRNISVLFILILGIIWGACNKKENEIGMEFQDPTLSLAVKRDVYKNIKAFTFLNDTLQTDSDTLKVVGYYQDPIFGKVQAGLYSQVSLSETKINLSDYTLDSLILSLQFPHFFPKINANLFPADVQLLVYQLAENLSKETVYYSTSRVNLNPIPLFAEKITLSHDSIVVDGEKYPPQIRVQLSPEFMNSLKRSFTNDEFLDFVKGINVQIDPEGWVGKGVMTYINMFSNHTCMTLYHTDAQGNKGKTRFLMGKSSKKFSSFEHDYTGTALDVFTNKKRDSIPQNPHLYLESMGGTFIRLNFPELRQWGLDHPRAILNEVNLILPVSNVTPDKEPPYKLECAMYRADGSIGSVLNSTSILFDGKYDSNKNRYRMRITHYAQNLVNGTLKDWGFLVFVSEGTTSANRCVIDGNEVSLEILYSE